MSYTTVGSRNLRKLLEGIVEERPYKTFLIFEESDGQSCAYTYQQFNQMVNQTANGLRQLGVSKGDKVNLHLTNRPEFLFFWFAIAKIGAVMVPTNPLSPFEELCYPLTHSASVVTVTQLDLLSTVEAVQSSCPDIRSVVLCGTENVPEGTISFSDLVDGQSRDLAEIRLDPIDEAAILYTSGTTSRPKGVIVTHANYVHVGEVVSKIMRMSPQDRHIVPLPLFHANAQYYSFMTTLTVGGSAALMPRFSASRYIRQAIRHKCTVSSLFAAPIRMILAQPRDFSDRANQLRLVIFAQNVTERQLEEWRNRFGAPLMQIYGMTEIAGQPLANPLDYPGDNMSLGMVTLGYECRVVNDLGVDVPQGESGQLLVKGIPGQTIMKGYFKNSNATEETIRDGWLRTGDIVMVDDRGYFRFVDRAKDMIKSSGENVAAGEVEAVIKQHGKVVDAAVIGVPDSMRDESIKAFIVPCDDEVVSEAEIIEFCRERLSKFRVPEFVEFRKELPRTSVGKIQKHLLRSEEAARREYDQT